MQTEFQLTVKQAEYIRNANHRWNVACGAVRSGKSYCQISYCIPSRLAERKGLRGLRVILGATRSNIERNILQPMRDIYGDSIATSINSQNFAKILGEKVYCIGADNIRQVSKIRGSEIAYCAIDEATDINEEVFEMLKSRLSLPWSCCDATTNPAYPNHWFKQFLDSAENGVDVYCQNYTIYDNPFLPPDYVSALETEYAGTVWYDRYILGKWTLAEGLIYRDFANHPGKYVISDVDSWLAGNSIKFQYISFGVDFGGTSSATKFQCIGITSDWVVVALDEEYIDHQRESVDPDTLNRKFAAFINRCANKWGAGTTRADSAEQILIRGLFNTARAQELKTQVKNALKMPINDRIKLTLLLMGQGRLLVSKDCPHLIDAFSSAVYDSSKAEDTRLDDGTSDIDSLDAFEYSIEPYYKQLEAAGHRRVV